MARKPKKTITTIGIAAPGGTLADHRSPRIAVSIGLPIACMSGVFYLVSALMPATRLAVLIAGRLLLDLAESLFSLPVR